MPFDTLLKKANEWAISKSMSLEAHPEYSKEVSGKIGVQAKWIS